MPVGGGRQWLEEGGGIKMVHACMCFWLALEKQDDENHIRITLTSI